jgi:hypothetical protein
VDLEAEMSLLRNLAGFAAPFTRTESLVASLLIITALQTLVKVACGLGLFADGSFYLLFVLEHRDVATFGWARWFAQVVTQAPLVLFVKAGLRDLNYLIYLHSFGLIAIPAGLWILALWKLRTSSLFWPFFMVFCVVYLNANLFPVGEHNLAFALAAVSMAVLLGPAPLSSWNGALLVAASIVSVRSYEAFVFLGVLLAGVAGARLAASGGEHRAEIVWLTAAIFFFGCASGVSWMSIARPRDAQNLAAALDLVTALGNSQILISVAVGAMFFLQFIAGAKRAVAITALTMGLLLSLLLLHPAAWAWPLQYYQGRSIFGGILFLALGGLAIWHFWNTAAHRTAAAHGAGGVNAAWALPVVLYLALSLSNLAHTLGFYHYLRVLHAEVTSRSGLVPIESTRLTQGNVSAFTWIWTSPTLSVLLRKESQQAIILNPAAYTGWQPFDPSKSVPDLTRYRMNAGKIFVK